MRESLGVGLLFFFKYGLYLVPLFVGLAAFCFFLYIYPILDARLAAKGGGYLDWMVVHLDRLFIKTTRQHCLIALIGSTCLFGLLGFALTVGTGFFNVIITTAAIYTGWAMPRLLIHFFWKRRLRNFDTQLTDALDLMSNSIKSGLNFLQIMQVVVQEMPNPLSQEFQLVLSQQHLGVNIDQALTNMMSRVPTEDLSMAINAILILRETGGNLSETFSVIASTIRERRKVEGKIRSLREQALFQSLILFCMPFGIGIAMFVINPDYLRPLFVSKWGYLMISMMLGLQVLGGIWLKKLISIDV